jgi:radical SAM superfamily enzyme YgiQ (UPF0313 family)
MTPNELAAITEKNIDSDTLAIGVSSTFWHTIDMFGQQYQEPKWVLDTRALLSTRINLPWLLGGYAATTGKPTLDWINFSGNAEDSLLKWMDENSSKLVRRDLFDVQNITKSFLADDFIQPHEAIPIELGRGCQFKCKFCSYPLIGKKKGTYLRDFGLIKDEFLRNYEEWGTTKYYFQDDTVNESEEKVRALADIAQSLPFKLEWVGYNRLDLIGSRPGTAQMLKDSGLRSAYFGIESFHPAASHAVGKGWIGKHGKDFLLKLKEEWKGEITWYLSLIIGLPGEGPESIEETQQWCIDNEMYEWNFIPLYINRLQSNVWKSEFEIEYEKYGYSFPDGADSVNWKNDIWTQQETQIFRNSLLERGQLCQKPTAYLLNTLVGLGYSFEELMHTRKNELDWPEFNRKTSVIVRNYVDFQLR